MHGLRLFLAVSVLVAGCSDDDSGGGGPSGGGDGPLYAVSSNAFSTDLSEESSLLWLTHDLKSGKLEPRDAIELPGGATIWSVPKSGVLYVISGEELTLTKYAVRGDGIAEVDRLGLASQGITSLIGETLVFDGPDRAYLFELLSAQMLHVDLKTMEITDSTDLKDAVVDELNLLSGPGFRQHGDKLVASIYGTNANYDKVSAQSKLLLLDPKTGEIEIKDTPCGGLSFSAPGPGGDLYFASDPYVAAVHLLNESDGPAPCLARLPRDADELASETFELNEITGGATGGLIAGSGSKAYLRVLDDAYTPPSDAGYLEVYSATEWRTWELELDDLASAKALDRAPVGGSIKVFDVDGTTFENETSADFASTRLIDTSQEERPDSALELPGITWGVLRVR